jgi:hypothetical protein
VIVLAQVLLLAGVRPAAAISLDVVPALGATGVGGEIEVMLRISGLGAGQPPSLHTFDLDVLFDPAVLFLVGVRFGDPVLGNQLDPSGQDLVVNEVFDILAPVGRVGLFGEALIGAILDDLQAGSFALATLAFLGIAPGRSTLGLTVFDLLDARAEPLGARVAAGAIAVTASPAALLLLGSGLLAAALGRRAGVTSPG